MFIKGVRREAGDETEILPRIFVTLPSNIPVHEIHAVFGNAAEHRWEGIVDRLDMELWANKTHGLVDDPIEMTARATSIELAGPNPFLLNLLLSLPPEAQINPWDALVSCAEEWLKNKTATWHDGLVDCWEEAIRLDTLVLVKRCDEATFKKRLWRAQTKVVLPILEGIRSRIVRRHRDYLSTIVPWDNPKYPGSHIRNHPDDFDIAELKRVLGHRLSEKEKDLIEFSAYKVRNDLAHMDPIDLDKLEKLLLLQDNIQSPSIEPGWDWPNAGQRLTMLIGSPAAGKSTWASKNCHEHEVISSDEVRSSSQAFQGIGKDGLVFAEVRRRAAALLKSGSNAVIDATHLKSEDRRETRKIIPEWMPIEYVVIDRPLEAKIRDQGWRVDVSESFVKEMHDRFQKAKDDILSGDGDLRVTVREIDL
ncbi:MAG: AAA family ATPase [Rhodospirillales bacterium]